MTCKILTKSAFKPDFILKFVWFSNVGFNVRDWFAKPPFVRTISAVSQYVQIISTYRANARVFRSEKFAKFRTPAQIGIPVFRLLSVSMWLCQQIDSPLPLRALLRACINPALHSTKLYKLYLHSVIVHANITGEDAFELAREGRPLIESFHTADVATVYQAICNAQTRQ